MLTNIACSRTSSVGMLRTSTTSPTRSGDVGCSSYTARLEWKTEVIVEVVVPADPQFVRFRVGDDLGLEVLLEVVVAAPSPPSHPPLLIDRPSSNPSTP